MKRALLILLVAAPAFGLTPLPQGNRIAVLRISDEFAHDIERTVAVSLQKDLRRELRARGFDAYATDLTYEDARREPANVDYYVEIVSGHAANHELGGIGAGIGHVGVDISVVTARVAAELRLYDAKTMQIIERYDLARHRTAIVPTGVGIGARSVWAFVALPFISHVQYRAAARAIARDAAERIANR